jgi:hypothetical protein
MSTKKTAGNTATAAGPEDQKPSLHITTEFNKKAEKPVSGGRIAPPSADRVHLKGKRYVITSAQNNTEVNAGFLKALETYCKARSQGSTTTARAPRASSRTRAWR